MTADRIDRLRLSATLRLCFTDEQAEALSTRLVDDEIDPFRALVPVVRLARLSYATDRWLSFLKLRPKKQRTRTPLHPRLGLPTVASLVLALHLGLDLNVETLARLFRSSVSETSVALQRARQEVDPSHISPCQEFVVQIGRYRDPSHDRLERLDLLHHLESCERCKLALDHSRKTDDQLLTVINQAEEALPRTPESTSSLRSVWLGPALFWTSLTLVGFALVMFTLIGVPRLLAYGRTPVPLRAARVTPPFFAGWVLETSHTGDVEAVNVANGDRRLLLQGDPTLSATIMISPDERRLARMTLNDGGIGRKLQVYSIEGVQQHEWTDLDQTGQYRLEGWLNADQLLVRRLPTPLPGEGRGAYGLRAEHEATLLAFDPRTGEQQVVLQEWVDSAYPSPDGKYVAIGRLASDSSVTLEIRPTRDSELGEPVVTLPDASFPQSGPPNLWTPDSQQVVVSRRLGSGTPAAQPNFELLNLDGQITPVHTPPDGAFDRLLGISPDGSHILYAETTGHVGTNPWAVFQVGIDGKPPQKLLDGGDPTMIVPVQRYWMPIGFAGSRAGDILALTTEQPFSRANPQPESQQTSTHEYVTLGFDMNGRSLGPLFGQFTEQALLAWLPENALVKNPASKSANVGSFHHDGRPEGVPSLTSDSRVSPDGGKVLIDAPSYHFTLAWPLSGSPQAQLAGAPYDPSWLPDSSGVIGVQRHTTGDGSTSRISIWGTVATQGPMLLDFDPAQLVNSTTATYHNPILSPNGLRYSFFVVDRQSVTLWIGAFNQTARIVASWNIPDDAKIEVPLIAAWAGNETFIFSQPDDWSGGFLRRVTLRRITIDSEDAVQLDPLLTWHARGGEKGVVLQGVRLSPDQSLVGYRLRRFTGTNLNTDRFDSITVAQSADLAHSIEIARGSFGDGMSWSPDGSELAAFINGGLQITSSDGKNVQKVDSGDGTFAYPVWVRSNEIWYQAIESGGQPLHYVSRATR